MDFPRKQLRRSYRFRLCIPGGDMRNQPLLNRLEAEEAAGTHMPSFILHLLTTGVEAFEGKYLPDQAKPQVEVEGKVAPPRRRGRPVTREVVDASAQGLKEASTNQKVVEKAAPSPKLIEKVPGAPGQTVQVGEKEKPPVSPPLDATEDGAALMAIFSFNQE
jgi:hypothetical protein